MIGRKVPSYQLIFDCEALRDQGLLLEDHLAAYLDLQYLQCCWRVGLP